MVAAKRKKRYDAVPMKGAPEQNVETALAVCNLSFNSLFQGFAKASENQPLRKATRYLAGIYYTTDPNACDLREMSKVPMFSKVALRTLFYWSTHDEWNARRLKYWKLLEEQAQAAIIGKLSAARAQEVRQLEHLWEDCYNKLSNNLVLTGTWEGVGHFMLKLLSQLEEHRVKATASQQVLQAGVNMDAKALLRVTDEEARAAALFLLERRRADQAKQVNPPDAEEGADG